MVYVKYKKATNVGVVKIPMQFMKFICMALKFGVWCAVNAHKFIKAMGSEGTNCS
jgi:hypothetical protein